MRCIDRWVGVGLVMGSVLAGCNSRSPAPSPEGTLPPEAVGAQANAAPAAADAHTAVTRRAAESVPLPAPGPVRSWDELRRQAARRIVAANPNGTYMGTVPDALLAIPVLEIELKRDGSISRIVLLRAPREAKDTSQLAIAAVHRAAPFGDVSKLPRPWKFTETFLFDDERKFKPRTLDE